VEGQVEQSAWKNFMATFELTSVGRLGVVFVLLKFNKANYKHFE
jgi:hypothetical protein